MKKILIIDDEQELLNMLEKFLTKKGHKVSTFSNPVMAIDYINLNNTDLVLLDIMMPQMDGIIVLDKLKQKSPNLKVLMMTAYSTLDRVLKSHKIGADDYILKPFESLALVEQKIQQY